MTVNLVIGTQWGDEGKGKVVDYYSKNADFVVRFQGGNNAGHTIKVGDEVYKLHITPSGVIQGKTGVIGNGCVVDPEVLLHEMEDLTKRGIKPKLFKKPLFFYLSFSFLSLFGILILIKFRSFLMLKQNTKNFYILK